MTLRLSVLAIAIALVFVPAIARAQQRVEHRDATRLSIKNSWLGVAPPSKATVVPQQVVVVPTIAIDPEPRLIVIRTVIAAEPVVLFVLNHSPDPLRGPPSEIRF